MTPKLYTMAMLALAAMTASAQNTPTEMMEKLDRGVVAITPQSGTGNFVSWRLLGTDSNTTTFDLMRNQIVIAKDIYATSYNDKQGLASSTYKVVTKVDGVPVDTSKAVTSWGKAYMTIDLDQPATGSDGGTYAPNDCSVGDVDGDGEYEIFLKWDPSTAKDNSQDGKTDNVYIDCYKLNGTKLWRIDLGPNIRAGAHYTQFQVYDFDGDGLAELICKTGPGARDGNNNYVNQAATDDAIKSSDNSSHRTSSGRINGGQEWLTVFNGQTGAAIHTIAYYPTRNGKIELSTAEGTKNWDDRSGKTDKGTYGNRGERYLAATAFLDGPDKNPSGIFSRGYYTYAYILAVDFNGSKLSPRWLHASEAKNSYYVATFNADGTYTKKTYSGCNPTSGSGSGTMYGNGNHNISIADVDGDGCDEIVWGSATCNNDGKLLFGTGFGHGDAIHMSDLLPDHDGLEVFDVHEDKGTYSWDIHDAATGAILLKGGNSGVDNGRGMAADIMGSNRGFEFWSSDERSPRSAVGGDVLSSKSCTVNFRIYWDGDLQDELLDGNLIDKWKDDGTGGTNRLATFSSYGGPSSTCNGTKNTPNLQADIFGDWREEVILHNGSNQLAIYSTTTETPFIMPTLMHDRTYRMGIAWQNTAYNQPPHLGYYLPDAMTPGLRIEEDGMINAIVGEKFTAQCRLKNVSSCMLKSSKSPDGTTTTYVAPTGFDYPLYNTSTKAITIGGTPTQEGNYVLTFTLTDANKNTSTLDVTVAVTTVETGIEEINDNSICSEKTIIYDAAGRMMPQQKMESLPRGLYIVKMGNKTKKLKVN